MWPADGMISWQARTSSAQLRPTPCFASSTQSASSIRKGSSVRFRIASTCYAVPEPGRYVLASAIADAIAGEEPPLGYTSRWRATSRAHVGSPMRGPATALPEITSWIDRPFSFLCRKKFRHHRHQLGRGVRVSEVGGREDFRTYLRVQRHIHESRPAAVRWLLREWGPLKGAILARLRGDTIVFEIGKAFIMGGRVWVCTDVGCRTICAVLLEELLAAGDSGPPYSICEHVIDRHDMDACQALR